MERYGRVSLTFDTDAKIVVEYDAEIVENVGGTADPDVAEIVEYWADQTEQILGEVIGYASETIERRSTELENLITDSWLVGFPHADISMTNYGGIRQGVRSHS